MKKFLKVILLFSIMILILLVLRFGIGFGIGGIGSGKLNQRYSKETDEIKNIKDETMSEDNYLKVTVSGSDYIYDNEKIQLEDLIYKLQEKEDNYTVRVIDDEATKNAYDNLLQKLDDVNIEYIE